MVSPIYYIFKIAIYEHDFADEYEALKYVFHNQVHRRNATDAELARGVEFLDKWKKSGERTDLASIDARSNGEQTGVKVRADKSSKEMADIMGISPRSLLYTFLRGVP